MPNNRGYGTVLFNGKRYMAHRASYEAYVRPIPDGMQIDHLCKQKLCINPHHLDVVTNRENQLRKDTTNICEHGNGISRCKLGCENKYRKELYYSDIKKHRERGKIRQRNYRNKLRGIREVTD